MQPGWKIVLDLSAFHAEDPDVQWEIAGYFVDS